MLNGERTIGCSVISPHMHTDNQLMDQVTETKVIRGVCEEKRRAEFTCGGGGSGGGVLSRQLSGSPDPPQSRSVKIVTALHWLVTMCRMLRRAGAAQEEEEEEEGVTFELTDDNVSD